MKRLLNNLFNSIVNPEGKNHSSNIEDMSRRKLFSIFLMLLIIPLLLFGTHLIKSGLYAYGIVDYIVSFLFLIFIIILKKVQNPRVLYRFALSLLCFLMIYWVDTGVGKGYGSLWVMTLPPFSFFLLGKKEGVIWTFFIFVTTATLFLVPSLSVNGFIYEMDFVSRYLFSISLIVLFTYSYESMREKYKNAIESEQQKLRDEKERLAKTTKEVEAINIRLNNEMNIREQAENDLRANRDKLEELVVERTIELQNMNARLVINEAKYKVMADNIVDMIWTADLNLRFNFVSPSVYRVLGYTVNEAMAMPFEKLNTPNSYSKVTKIYSEQIELLKNGKSNFENYQNIELEHIRKDGTVVPVEVTASFLKNSKGESIGVVGITRDISERVKALEENKKIHEQLAQSQKMEAIGTLVSGIAHDFNNILGGIIGSFDLLTRILKDESLDKRVKVDKYLQLGMESSLRSAELIKQLLSLSRKHEITLSPVDLNYSLNHVIEICRNSLPKTVEIDYLPSPVPLVVMGDVVQIEQVFLNLCINASHAMTIMRNEESKQGGILKLRCSEVQSDYIIKELYPEQSLFEGTWIKVEVLDTGVGMDEETKNKIFDPFFSKKEQNEGSGLGLSISYNIIRKHSGIIHIYSEQGKGSCFSVYIPSYSNTRKVEGGRKVSGDLIKGTGTILVIDDEHAMLNVAKGFLEECGYNVLIADNGDEGINIYAEKHRDICAVLIDLSMPVKSGLEVFLELKSINKDVKVILASGMLDSDSRFTADKMGIKGTVLKPYLADELSMMIKSII